LIVADLKKRNLKAADSAVSRFFFDQSDF